MLIIFVFQCTLAKNSWNFILAFLIAESAPFRFGWWWGLVRVSEQLIIFLNLIFTSCSWFMVTHISDLKLSLFRIVFFKYGPDKNLWKLKLAFLAKVAPLCFIWLGDSVDVSEYFFESDFSVAFLCASRFCDYYYVIFMISWICLMFLIAYFPVICHVSKPEIFSFWSK